MEKHILNQKLYMIAFGITTPLVSLSGFCDVVKDRTDSQFVIHQIEVIKGAVENIKSKKDILIDKIRADDDPDFISDISSASYLQKFASELWESENKIISSVNRLLEVEYAYDHDDPTFDDWAKRLSSNATAYLHQILEALRNIGSDLEIVISKGGG